MELTVPLTHIINTALATGQYPAPWKREYVSPVPKVKEPQVIKDVRKIAGTSEYNKLLESFLKDIFIEDVLPPETVWRKKEDRHSTPSESTLTY